MERPRSIMMFERCYLAAFAISVISTAFLWADIQARVAPQLAMLGAWFLPVMTAIGFAIPLLLWYFIARRGSVVAKWIATVLVAFAVAGVVFTLLSGTFPEGLAALLAVVRLVLQIASIWFIFRPDTRAWFGEKPEASV
jgi:hypothetical protein